MMVELGMFESQAEKVMEVAMPEVDSLVDDYKFTWDRPATEYPDAVYKIVFNMNIKPIAFKWIEENVPMAWFKPMFTQ